MDRFQRRRVFGLGAIGVAVLSLLMLTAVGARSLPGTTRSLALSWTIDVIEVLQIGVGVVILGAILWSLVRRRSGDERPERKALPRRQSAWAVLLVLAAVALVIVWLISRPDPTVLEELPQDLNISEVDFLPVESAGDAWPLLVLIAGTLIAAFAVNRLTRPEPSIEDDIDPAGLLAETLTDALDRLSWSDDPRDVIIKAYHGIERAFAAAGMPPWASEAPRQFLERVLTSADVEEEAITRLTALFEQARFSDHDMDESDRVAAIEAMEAVRADLPAPA